MATRGEAEGVDRAGSVVDALVDVDQEVSVLGGQDADLFDGGPVAVAGAFAVAVVVDERPRVEAAAVAGFAADDDELVGVETPAPNSGRSDTADSSSPSLLAETDGLRGTGEGYEK
ncbi:hypothetical protein [Rhodococcus sp. T2V]|uniref:hypothetical protein n=1 Tax=Rhodococcus sp. T2V TaxID=3034164 RepID=UPI0023E2DFAB|nr:hypothetical protein [Rhodococcus sp. T2V]